MCHRWVSILVGLYSEVLQRYVLCRFIFAVVVDVLVEFMVGEGG